MLGRSFPCSMRYYPQKRRLYVEHCFLTCWCDLLVQKPKLFEVYHKNQRAVFCRNPMCAAELVNRVGPIDKNYFTLKFISYKVKSTFSPISDIPTLISEDELSDSTRPDFRRPLVGVRGGGVAGVSQGQTSSEVDVPGTMFGFLTLFNNTNLLSNFTSKFIRLG